MSTDVASPVQNPLLNRTAATFVVDPTGADADFTTIAAALLAAAALPAGVGADIYLGKGTYTLVAGLVLPAKNITIRGAGRNVTFLDFGSNAVSAFSLATNQTVTIRDLTVLGDDAADQTFFEITAPFTQDSPRQYIQFINVQLSSSAVIIDGMRTLFEVPAAAGAVRFTASNCFFHIGINAAAHLHEGTMTTDFVWTNVAVEGAARIADDIREWRWTNDDSVGGLAINPTGAWTINSIRWYGVNASGTASAGVTVTSQAFMTQSNLVLNTIAPLSPISLGGSSFIESCFLGGSGVTFGDDCLVTNSTIRGDQSVDITVQRRTKISNCTLTGTVATAGGALGDDIQFSNCAFVPPVTVVGSVLDIVAGDAEIIVDGCRFRWQGGTQAILSAGSEVVISDCIFDPLLAPTQAINISAGSEVVIEGCTFKGTPTKQIEIGAGVANLTVSDCIFKGTQTDDIIESDGTEVSISNCVFDATAPTVIDANGDDTSISNCKFIGFTTDAINAAGLRALISDCTFIGTGATRCIDFSSVNTNSHVRGCLFVSGYTDEAIDLGTGTGQIIEACVFEAASARQINGGPCDNVTITSCQFTGATTDEDIDADGVEWVIADCIFTGFLGDEAILGLAGSDRMRISNCFFNASGLETIEINGDDNSIQGCRFIGFGTTAISVLSDGLRTFIDNCSFEGNGTADECIEFTGAGTDSHIRGCIFDGYDTTAIDLGSGTGYVVSDCIFKAAAPRQLDGRDNASRVTVTGCQFEGASTVEDVVIEGSDWAITGCIFTGFAAEAISGNDDADRLKIANCIFESAGTNPIDIAAADDVSIVGCKFGGFTDEAIELSGLRAMISTCVFTGTAALRCVDLTAVNTDTQIRGCSFDGYTDEAIDLGSGTGQVISDCVFNAASARQIDGSGADGVTVTGCQFEGATTAEDIDIDGTDWAISNCNFLGFTVEGIFASGVSDRLRISNCTFDSAGTEPIEVDGDDTVITNCTFTGFASEAIDISGDRGLVDNCTFVGNGTAAECIDFTGSASEGIVRGCTFDGYATAAISLNDGVDGGNFAIANCIFKAASVRQIDCASAPRVTITGCNFEGATTTEDILVNGADSIISACTFTGFTSESIDATGAADRLQITGCTFNSAGVEALDLDGDDTTVSGCVFIGFTTTGASISGNRTLVSNCVFTGTAATRCIDWTGASEDGIVHGCVFDGYATDAINLGSGDRFQVVASTFKAAATRAIDVSGAANTTITGCSFTGATTAEDIDVDAPDCTISNCNFTAFTGEGIDITDAGDRCKISNCVFSSAAVECIDVDGVDVHISNCSFELFTGQAISSDEDRTFIDNCSFQGTAATRCIDFTGTATEGMIRGCTFDGYTTDAINLEDDRFLISDCYFLAAATRQIQGTDLATNCSVTACHFEGATTTDDIFIDGSDWTIQGCTFTGFTDKCIDADRSTAARLRIANCTFTGPGDDDVITLDAEDGIITGCSFANWLVNSAIDCDAGCVRTVITGCTFQGGATSDHCIEVNSGATDTIIQGCFFAGYTVNGVEVFGEVVISGCIFDNNLSADRHIDAGGATQLNITGCTFRGGVVTDCIEVGAEDPNISGCLFAPLSLRCVDILVGADNGALSGCTFVSFSSEAVRIAANSWVVTGNKNCEVLETGSADFNHYDNNDGFAASTIIGTNSTIDGSKRFLATGVATAGVFTNQFTHTNKRGLLGIGTIVNTGAAAIEVREVVTDSFGTTVTQSPVTTVPAGGNYMLDPQTNFTDGISTAFPPYVSFAVEVKDAGAGASTFDIAFTSQAGEN